MKKERCHRHDYAANDNWPYGLSTERFTSKSTELIANSFAGMNASRKRQKVASACERCRKRKLGVRHALSILRRTTRNAKLMHLQCDRERPCQLCVRAGAECVARDPGAPDRPPSASKRRAPDTEAVPRSSDPGNSASPQDSGHDLVMPESSIVDLTALVCTQPVPRA